MKHEELGWFGVGLGTGGLGSLWAAVVVFHHGAIGNALVVEGLIAFGLGMVLVAPAILAARPS